MHVVVHVGGQVEVHHVRNVRDIQTARRDVRRDQHADAPLPESLEGLLAQALGQVAVDRRGPNPVVVP